MPFIDVSKQEIDGEVILQEEPIYVDRLYHGQYSMGGEEITAHSPFWSPHLYFALGHALFGAELEKEVKATRCIHCKRGCEKCEEGWILLNRETDDLIPRSTPIVLQLNFDSPQTVLFGQDIEHEKGKSYIIQHEVSEWEIVSADRLIPILEKWIEEDKIPKDVLYDTGAGYVSDEEIIWFRVKQALNQLYMSKK